MHRFLTRFFLISFLAVSISSCAVKTVAGYNETDRKGEYETPYFSDRKTDYIYKAHILVYGKEFGGIFIVKKVSDSAYRAAFTTEFGNKLFDFEITDASFKVNYILEDLDRKIILNTLKRDFMLLLKQTHAYKSGYENAEFSVIKSADDDRYNYLFINKKSNTLVKLVNTTKSKEKIIVSYEPENDALARKIIIDHKNIDLKIELTFIK